MNREQSIARRWRLTWIVATVFLFLLFSHRAWFIPETDFAAYYRAGARALTGAPLYIDEPTPFKYLPVTSFLFVPFSFLPFQVAKYAFFLFSFALGWLFYRNCQRKLGNRWTLFLLAAFLRFHNHDFLNSQVNHVLLGLFSFYLDRPQGWRRNSAFAFFASFKVLPLMALGPIFLSRRWKDTAQILLALAILVLIPALTFSSHWRIYADWMDLLRLTTPYPAPESATLQSVQGALWYYLRGWITPYTFTAAIVAAQLGLIGLLLGRSWRPAGLSEFQLRLRVSAAIALSIAFSPLAWKHNYVLLAPAVALLLESGQFRAAIAVGALLSFTPEVFAVFSKHVADRSYSTLLGALTLYFLMLKDRTSAQSRQHP